MLQEEIMRKALRHKCLGSSKKNQESSGLEQVEQAGASE